MQNIHPGSYYSQHSLLGSGQLLFPISRACSGQWKRSSSKFCLSFVFTTYFSLQITLPRKVCTRGCIYKGLYLTHETDIQLRWCDKCQKWFHDDCSEGTQIEKSLLWDFDQTYLDLDSTKLDPTLSRIISLPVARISRHHKTPATIELLQQYLRDQFSENTLFNMGQDWLQNVVTKSGFISNKDDTDKETIRQYIEMYLNMLENDLVWYMCPVCKHNYI